jgi:ribosomal protein L11 methyltransferase
MEYLKLNCRIEPDNEINREILIAELGEIGFESFAEINEVVEAFIPFAKFSEDLLINDVLIATQVFTFSYTFEKIPDQNWNEVWEKNYFEPLLINEQCLIRAPFHTKYPRAQYEIVINPKMAFGTGNHETTSLMVSEILKSDLTGKRVLDMGCGTGILGILASMMGAASVTSIDIDEWAYNNTIENASYNKIFNLDAKLGGTELLKGNNYDFILANIQRNILLNDLQYYFDALSKSGRLIMSGFYLNDLPAIQLKTTELGLKFWGYNEKNKWIAATFMLE